MPGQAERGAASEMSPQLGAASFSALAAVLRDALRVVWRIVLWSGGPRACSFPRNAAAAPNPASLDKSTWPRSAAPFAAKYQGR